MTQVTRIPIAHAKWLLFLCLGRCYFALKSFALKTVRRSLAVGAFAHTERWAKKPQMPARLAQIGRTPLNLHADRIGFSNRRGLEYPYLHPAHPKFLEDNGGEVFRQGFDELEG